MEEDLYLPVDTARDHIQGDPTASVTLVQYGDYECPYTRRSNEVVRELQAALGEDLRFVFRNFPLTEIHPHAQLAAEAAEEAAAQGKFWEMHDYLFHHQKALEGADLKQYAQAVGLDTARFDSELEQHSQAEHIQEDVAGGEASGVQGTPTFFINGQRHDASYDFDTMLAVVENARSNK